MTFANAAAHPATTRFVRPARPRRSPAQRALARAQQPKDAFTSAWMPSGGPLGFGVVFGITVPGLVPQALRWKQVPYSGRASGTALWALRLTHELACVAAFYSDKSQGTGSMRHFGRGCVLGANICLVALVQAARASAEAADSDA